MYIISVRGFGKRAMGEYMARNGMDEFIANFMEGKDNEALWDCVNAFSQKFKVCFKTAFDYVSNYASRKWKVKELVLNHNSDNYNDDN